MLSIREVNDPVIARFDESDVKDVSTWHPAYIENETLIFPESDRRYDCSGYTTTENRKFIYLSKIDDDGILTQIFDSHGLSEEIRIPIPDEILSASSGGLQSYSCSLGIYLISNFTTIFFMDYEGNIKDKKIEIQRRNTLDIIINPHNERNLLILSETFLTFVQFTHDFADYSSMLFASVDCCYWIDEKTFVMEKFARHIILYSLDEMSGVLNVDINNFRTFWIPETIPSGRPHFIYYNDSKISLIDRDNYTITTEFTLSFPIGTTITYNNRNYFKLFTGVWYEIL